MDDDADQPASQLIPAKNGALRDPVTGRIVANPPGGTINAITPANSGEYQRMYAQKRIEAELAAGRGMARIAGGSELDAWSDIAEQQARLAIDTEKGRASTEASRFVCQAAGFIAERGRSSPETGANTLQITLTNDAIMQIMSNIRPLLPDRGGDSE